MSGIYRSLSSDLQRSLRSAGHRSWQIRQPAAQSKLRELRQRARSACFVPVVAINKPDFLAGYLLFYVSARYRAVFLAAIENNQNFSLRPIFWPQLKTTGIKILVMVQFSVGEIASFFLIYRYL